MSRKSERSDFIEAFKKGATLYTKKEGWPVQVVGHGEVEGKQYLHVKFPTGNKDKQYYGMCYRDGSWQIPGDPFFKLSRSPREVVQDLAEQFEQGIYTNIYLRADGTHWTTSFPTLEQARNAAKKANSELVATVYHPQGEVIPRHLIIS